MKFPVYVAGSRFGGILDMLTDRCATMCLLVVLCLFYPAFTFLFQLSMCIDIVSHWIHVQRYNAFAEDFVSTFIQIDV